MTKAGMDRLIEEALAEIAAEEHRAAVEAEKARLRAKQRRSIWRRLFPFKITIERIV